MLKYKMLVAFGPAIPVIILILIVIMTFAVPQGGAAAEPVRPPATPEKAQEYGMIASEVGAPWEIVLIADAHFALLDGESDIEDVNPVHTSLEFIILKEDCYKWDIVGYESSDADGEDGESEDGESPSDPDEDSDDSEDSGGSTSTPVYGWKLYETIEYSGKDEILSYVELDADDIDNKSPSEIVSIAYEIAESKFEDGVIKYEVSISVNTDFEYVLINYLDMDEDDARKVVQIYESQYISYLYFGDVFVFIGEYDLPPVTVGNVTRDELAKLAASIIGHPYYWGGKSTQEGAPAGALDCSGFIDWVYFQCFGVAVNGVVPPGSVVFNGTAIQYYSSAEISEAELMVGDLGFYYDPAKVKDYNHVGIYVGQISGRAAFLHCGGSGFGTPEQPTGRVGISINNPGTMNSYNPIDGSSFEPPMKGTNFKYFRRPNFQFVGDVTE